MAQSWDLEWFYFADLLVLASGRQVPCDSISQSLDATRTGNSGARAQLEFANKLIRESISRTTGTTPASRRLAKAMRSIMVDHDRYGARYRWSRRWGRADSDSWGPQIQFYDASNAPTGTHKNKVYFETFVDDHGIHLPWPTPFFALRPFREEIASLLGIYDEGNLPAPPSYQDSIGFNTLFFAYEDIAMPDQGTLSNFAGLSPDARRSQIINYGKTMLNCKFELPPINFLDFPVQNMPTDHAFLSKRDAPAQEAPWALVTGDTRYTIEKWSKRDEEFYLAAADFPCDQFSETTDLIS